MKRYFELKGKKAAKFWEIEIDGNCYTVRSGNMGMEGKHVTEKCPSDDSALMQAKKLINNKLKKGYTEVKENRDNFFFLTCKNCKTKITPLLKEVIVEDYNSLANKSLEKDFVGKGFFFIDPWGNYVCNMHEDINVIDHPNSTRVGCCGTGVTKLICFSCRLGIGEQYDDCIFPEYIKIFDTSAELIYDKWNIFGTFYILENKNFSAALKDEFDEEKVQALIKLEEERKEIVDTFYKVVTSKNDKLVEKFNLKDMLRFKQLYYQMAIPILHLTFYYFLYQRELYCKYKSSLTYAI